MTAADHHRLQEELSRYQGIAEANAVERDRLAKVLRRIAKSDMGWAGKTAQAALARTEQP